MRGVGSSRVPEGKFREKRTLSLGQATCAAGQGRGVLRFCFPGELPSACGMLWRWDQMPRTEGRVTQDRGPSFWYETNHETLKRQPKTESMRVVQGK